MELCQVDRYQTCQVLKCHTPLESNENYTKKVHKILHNQCFKSFKGQQFTMKNGTRIIAFTLTFMTIHHICGAIDVYIQVLGF